MEDVGKGACFFFFLLSKDMIGDRLEREQITVKKVIM